MMFVSFLFLLAVVSSTASTTNIPWAMTFGGQYSEGFNQIINTSDGGYALAGFTTSYGSGTRGVWLAKIDSQGNMLWNNTYGGTGQSDGNSIVQTIDGGYAIAGYSTSYGEGSHHQYLVRTDANGNELWNRTYMDSKIGNILDIAALPDNSLILAGIVYTDSGIAKASLIKTDADGNVLWNRTYGGARKDEAHFVAPTADGGFIVAGYTQSYGDQKGDFFINGTGDAWLLRTDAQGNERWNKTYGGDAEDQAYCVLQSADGGYLLGGTTKSFANDSVKAYIIKTDAQGNEQWYRTYGNNSSNAIYDIENVGDGYVMLGTTYPHTGNIKAFLIKIDDTGNNIWGYSYGENGDYYGYSFYPATDGGYVVAGIMNSTADVNDIYSKGYVLKINGNGMPVMIAANITADDSQTSNSLSPMTIVLSVVIVACAGIACFVIWKWILKG